MPGGRSSRSLPLRACLRIEVALERVQGLWPHGLVFRDPLIEFHESPWFQCVNPLLRVHLDVYKPRVTEHLKVARHGGLREVQEPGRDIACPPAASCEKIEDRPARRIRDRKEDARHGLLTRTSSRTSSSRASVHAFHWFWAGCSSVRWLPSGSVKYAAIP